MTSLYHGNEFNFGQEPMFEDFRDESAIIHDSALVDAPARIGQHTRIAPFVHVMANTMIGEYCQIGHHATLAPGVMLGNNVRVMNNALLNSGVVLEDDVYCGASVVFAGMERLRGKRRGLSRISPTLVKQGANLGPNSSIASGVLVGRFAFVEAGSVVDSNIPDFALVWGNPIRFRGWRCECGSPLPSKQSVVECEDCGLLYERKSRLKLIQLSRPTQPNPATASG